MAENNQIIITIGRKFGSMGHKIAKQLGEELGMDVVDRKLLFQMAEQDGFDRDFLNSYDEKPINHFTSGEVRGHSNSIEKILAEKIFKYQNDFVATGKSFIFVGRCAEHNLRGTENHIRIFITADEEARIARIAEVRELSERDAKHLVHKVDKRRMHFNHSHGNAHWGETDNYDLIINTSDFDLESSVAVIKNYIEVWKTRNHIDTDD